MRKRRRLANKMTIMVCAVLIAVSAFFYAPMEVRAEEFTASGSASQINVGLTGSYSYYNVSTSSLNLGAYDSEYVNVSLGISYTFTSSRNFAFLGHSVLLHCGDSVFSVSFSEALENRAGITSYTENDLLIEFICKSSDLQNVFLSVGGTTMSVNNYPSGTTTNYGLTASFDLISVSLVSSSDSEDYQNGYNAGYSAGEQAGYGNGYSNGFADGEASVDTDAIYDEAFQAGKDSVDTQSYYDAGYQAGYQVAYSDGYESGYDVGYQEAMDRIASWGADTSDYPVLKYSFFDDELRLICDVHTSAPSTSYASALLCYLDFDINPNHTYKFVVRTDGTTGGTYNALYSEYKLNFVIGSNVINATNNVGQSFDFFIPGYNMGSSILFEAFVYDCVYYGGVSEEDGFLKYSGQVYPTLKNCYIDIYDMGPSGDTQNHIANQTDQLTNGYDDSKGNTVNSELSTGLNEFETAENSLFATATTGMKDFTFFDFESVPAMITGMSFIGSIMGSWFNQAGGASGVGIVLSILFSVILVAMVLGLYRWYQSRGGRN